MPQQSTISTGTALDSARVGQSVESGADGGNSEDTGRISVDLLGGLCGGPAAKRQDQQAAPDGQRVVLALTRTPTDLIDLRSQVGGGRASRPATTACCAGRTRPSASPGGGPSCRTVGAAAAPG